MHLAQLSIRSAVFPDALEARVGCALRSLSPRLAVTCALLAAGAGLALSGDALRIPVVVGLALVAGFVAARLSVAVPLLVASFYFEGYLHASVGSFTGDPQAAGATLSWVKAIGALAVIAWMLERVIRRRPVLLTGHLLFIAGLAIWLVPSLLIALERPAEQSLAASYTPPPAVAASYVMFFALFFLVLQTVAEDRRRLESIVDVAIGAGAVSACFGLVSFFVSGQPAIGLVSDPNDFGLLLASTLPLALWRVRWARSAFGRGLAVLTSVTLAASLLATFSRGALVSLAVMAVWALATKRVRLTHVGVAGVMLAATALTAYLAAPRVVDVALQSKSAVAGEDVVGRYYYWDIALRQAASSPVVGVGVGNYQARFGEFGSPFILEYGPQTTHNVYLNVLAELGAPGLLLFLGFIGVSWWWLRCDAVVDPAGRALQTALAAGFIAVLCGAVFVPAVFSLPLWLLPALGAGLVISERSR